MLIGLIADTHDNLPLIEKAVERFNEAKVDLVLHAGDLISPFTLTAFGRLQARMIAVFGNNDGERTGWRERAGQVGEVHDRTWESELAGRRIILMHEPFQLDALAESGRFDVIVYGHTHRVDIRRSGKALVVNPGECGGWLSGRSTVALLDLPSCTVESLELRCP